MRKLIKPGVLPYIWPNCPTHMSKGRKKRPTQHSSSEKRERRDLEAKLLAAETEEKANEILRLQDLSKVNAENTPMLKTAKSIAFKVIA